MAYEFKSKMLATLMGAMFDAAFGRFSAAFEKRADMVYGKRVVAVVRLLRHCERREAIQTAFSVEAFWIASSLRSSQ